MLLEVKDLKTYFYTKRGVAKAVDGVSFSVEKSRVLAIVGESGCGKSVTGLSIMRLLEPPARVVSGQILYDGTDLLGLGEKAMDALRGREISMIFQDAAASLDPVMTVGKQIAEVLKKNGVKNARERESKIHELLDRVHIKDAKNTAASYPFQLSGGMCQRIMTTIAMCANPGLLIADEPTTALDVTVQLQILSLIDELRGLYGTAVILITHDMGVVARMADEVMVLYCGQVVERAEVHELFDNPLHPYTKALLASIPSVGGGELACIEGSVPDLTQLPPGCVFSNRCGYCEAACLQAPALAEARDGHWVRCRRVETGALI
jgi:peptide/nickel transport system ATP-binding protein/oligopeptide transport system ATP-binding protein